VEENMRLARLALIFSLVSAPAVADGWVPLGPSTGFAIAWDAVKPPRVLARPQVLREELSPLDRWFQVAPGRSAVAFWSASSGLAVCGPSGAELYHREGEVTAFRFSPAGDRLAFSSVRGIEVLALDTHTPRKLAPLAGVNWLQWTDVGLVARARRRLYIVDEAGKQRALATLPAGATIAAARSRLVYFAGCSLHMLDLAGGSAAEAKLNDCEPVINAELSPDGGRLLFATAKRVYLRQEPATEHLLAEAEGVHSLFFSPDGASLLWASGSGGEVLSRDGRMSALPPDIRSARFVQDGGATVVVTTRESVALWDGKAKPTSVGGEHQLRQVNYAGDWTGSGGFVRFYYQMSVHEQKMEWDITPPPLQ
jgi:hypothetical protein